MKLKEKLSYFWNVTLGADYTEKENIEESENPEYAELKESLERVKTIEQNFNKSTSSNKGGKGNSGKNKIVETVVINPKVISKVAEAKKETVSKEAEER